MNLIKIVYGSDRGGILSCETQYIGILKKKGVNVFLIIVGEGVSVEKYKNATDNCFQIKGFDIRFNGGTAKRLLKLLFCLWFGLKHAIYLIKHYKHLEISGIIYRREAFMFLGGILSFFLKTTCYWHMANTVNTTMSKWINTAVCKVLKIIPLANSHFTMMTLGPICKHVVYPGFGTDRLDKPFNQDFFGIAVKEGAPVFGMIARVCHDKAQDLLVRGFVNSDVIGAGGHLILAGNISSDKFLDEIKKAAGDYWGKQIHYIGVTDEAAKFYGLIDVAVNSRRNAEPFGISIAEALYMRKPILSYFKGGPSEMIVEGQNGWFVNEVNANAYRDTFNRSLLEREKWVIMGENSYKSAKPFSSVENVEKLISIVRANQVKAS